MSKISCTISILGISCIFIVFWNSHCAYINHTNSYRGLNFSLDALRINCQLWWITQGPWYYTSRWVFSLVVENRWCCQGWDLTYSGRQSSSCLCQYRFHHNFKVFHSIEILYCMCYAYRNTLSSLLRWYDAVTLEMYLRSFMPGSHNIVVTQMHVVWNTGWLVGHLAKKQEVCIRRPWLTKFEYVRDRGDLEIRENKLN